MRQEGGDLSSHMPVLPKAGLWQHLRGLFSPEKTRHVDLTPTLQYLKGADRKGGEGLSIKECSDRKRGNCFKLRESRFTLNMKKTFFTLRMMKH